MTEQPESLRLADWCRTWNTTVHNQVEAELRRQHAEIERLRNDLAVYRNKVASVIVTAPAAADDLIATYEKGFRDGAAQRQPLTDEEIRKFADTHLFYQPEGYEVSGIFNLARAIEAAHGIKGKA